MAPVKLPMNFQFKLFFFGQGQDNNLASSSTHSLLGLLIVFKACSFNAHDFPTKKPKRSYDKVRIF